MIGKFFEHEITPEIEIIGKFQKKNENVSEIVRR